ncbi:isocitrate lyase/PEP mutase family protein [Abyssalbus ytuae]|uniref:Isocitrate lyase/phosphoenolpyruvate mutase family protein n=1 Tax=Abyssalbus ytuae TaxID=2926907 RepID=A0A9E7CTE5_9FLAO|nr:isocitrate lyase/phosphoenolpyruvate mutase family protein [Abyssalbus ytuae]UOB16032.1 isocitrate lyase/phosphoenolpyruvate mutase family protein [Abyssalbus ytuae]
MNFKQLHQQAFPLLIANVWDVPSSKVAEGLNFAAVGTSSAAIAASLGYEDGEHIPFSKVDDIVKRIKATIRLPLSVDLEAGYGQKADDIVQNIKKLHASGVCGINIEDSKVSAKRQLQDAGEFAEKLFQIKNQLTKDKIDIFLNVRTDTFLLNIPQMVEQTTARIKLYEKAGADGIFVPGMVNIQYISHIVQSTTLPVNVMCLPDLPDFDTLGKIGVKRISMGNFLFEKMYSEYEALLNSVATKKSFKEVF